MFSKIGKLLYIILGCVFIVLVIIFINLNKKLDKAEDWVAGQYGKYCYEEENMPNTIKRPVYFENLDDCLKFVNQ